MVAGATGAKEKFFPLKFNFCSNYCLLFFHIYLGGLGAFLLDYLLNLNKSL